MSARLEMHGPTLILDKSTLQSLRAEEAKWLSHHYHANLILPLYVEIVGALTASDRKDPVADVASLARKMLVMGLTTTPNIGHDELATSNLLGQTVEMDGRIILGGGKKVLHPDGTVTLVYDEPPQIEALRRLAKGTFTEDEKKGAVLLRKFIAGVNLERIREVFQGTPPEYKVRSLAETLFIVDRILDGSGRRFHMLRTAMEELQIPLAARGAVIERWKRMGGPPLKDFAPYSHYKLRVQWFFDLAMGADLVKSSDPKHFIDLMYIFYLPFCEVFASTDKFHQQVVSYFLRPDQRFVWGPDLKADAAKLTAHYEALPEDIRRTGSLNYARLPPKDGDFLTARIFDELRPGWRASRRR
jgi:hypothetical protein